MSDKVYIGPNKVGSFEKKGEYEPVSRVTMWWGDGEDEYFTAGDDTGREMRLNNPYATQAIVDNAAKMLKGHIYRPFEARDVIWDPTIELGDGINIGGIYSMLGHVDMKFGPEIIANISCPGGNVIDHEIPYIDPDKLEMRRRVKLGQTYFGTKITRKDGLVIENVDDKTNKVLATAVLNANILAFYKGQSREKEDAQLYFDTDEGVFKFRGALNVNNNFVVDADGNVVMKGGITLDGAIKWGTDNIPNKKRYAASTSGPWHDTMQDGDIYCCDWDYSKNSEIVEENWGEAYKFKGVDGQPGAPATLPGYIKKTHIDATGIETFHIKANKIEAVCPAGSADDTETGFILTGGFGNSELQYLRIYSYEGDQPYTVFTSPKGCAAFWMFPETKFTGKIDFEGADVRGIHATFA